MKKIKENLQNETIFKVGGIILNNRKIIVCQPGKHEYFTAPGGRIENNETPVQALIRELDEELNIEVLEKDLEKFGNFEDKAAGEEKNIKMEVFVVKRYNGDIRPGSEIKKVAWINSNRPGDMRIGSIFEHKVIPMLKKGNLID